MTKLNIGDAEFNSEDVAITVENDIAFLTERLRILEKQKAPNAVMLQTYRDMLDSRLAVLNWLRQGNTKPCSQKDSNAN
ncbi:MAG TPA: hypothetical protein VN030_02740 [Cellvibrio sp.]|nr:hypothetical protein [Cellvibrio sp.]